MVDYLVENLDKPLTVDHLAARSRETGFGTAAGLRHHFANRLGTTSRAYRTTFAGRTSWPSSRSPSGGGPR